tara:strand:+ start:9814 stop:11754 length:1941 start_codon:yes stop_codon:yes gene_type:complete
MKIKVFEPPLPDFDQMSEGGEVKPRKMFVGGGFNLEGFSPNLERFSNSDVSAQIQKSVQEALAKENIPDFSQNIADLEKRLAEISSGVSEQDVASQISKAVAGLPEGITEADVQKIVDANPGLTREEVVSLIQQNPGIQLSDVQSEIDKVVANLPEGLSEADVERILGGADTVSSRDLAEALANIPSGDATREELRELAEEIYREQGQFASEAGQGDIGLGSQQFKEEEIERILDRLLANAGVTTGGAAAADTAAPVTGVDQETVTQTIQDMLSAGTLTPEEIQRRIDAGDITKEDVLSIIQGGFELSEGQLAQLFESGVLTREEIAALVEEAIAGVEISEGVTEEDIERIAEASGLSEERVQELISEQLQGFDPNIDTNQFATQEQLQGLATQEQLSDFATQEQLQGLESMFQNYLTPEQLQSYLPQEGQYITPEQLAEATANDYDDIIKGLTDKLGELETKYQNVTDQYEADAVNAQINKTKDDLNTFFRGAVPSGPRTGSTSQFTSGASFLPGGSSMANLIAGQRQGLGQDPFSTYLKTFTPSYSAYDAPVTAEEYGLASLPLIDTQYSNPFTGGASYRSSSPTSVTTAGADGRQYGLTVMPDDDPGSYNQGGQVSNGIMDLTNFQTNVQPFQNAFRPNVPRN